MAPPLHTRLTYDDLLLFPYDGKRHELLDGDHFMTPSPNTKHQRIVSRLNQVFSNYLDQHPIGEVFPALYDVVLRPMMSASRIWSLSPPIGRRPLRRRISKARRPSSPRCYPTAPEKSTKNQTRAL